MSPLMLSVFIYIRVSSDEQEDNTSLEQQEIDCRAYCEMMGFAVVAVFREVYSAGTWEGRQVFKSMRERYLRGEAQGVVVRTYSRFTCDIAHYYILTEEMKYYNVALYCVKEQYDNSPMGRMLQAIQMGFNEQERATTRQRTIDGKLARVTNKKQYLAGKKAPYGYSFNNEKTKDKLVICEEEAEIVRKILKMRVERIGYASIARGLMNNEIPSPSGGDSWNERTLRIIVERAGNLYRGIAYAFKYEYDKEYRNGREVIVKREKPVSERVALPEGTVPRIIEDERGLGGVEASPINTQEATRHNPYSSQCLLRSGHIKCGHCKGAMTAHSYPDKVHRETIHLCYRCSGERRVKKTCEEHIEIAVPKIDKIVWDYVCEVIRDIQIIESAVNAALDMDMFASAEKAANKTIAECKDLIEQYREDLKTTGLSKGARMVILEDLGKQTELLERFEDGLVSIQQGKISYNHVMAEYRKFLAWCEEFKKHGKKTATYKEKRDALRFLGLTVYIYKKGGPDGRYDIQLAPPQLMQALQIVPKNTDIGGTIRGLYQRREAA